MLITDKLSMEMKCNFKLIVLEGVMNQLSPAHRKEIHSAKSKSNVYSKITRELFHRLLQLHSPIKLKSNGSNASYISLLACECLQNAIETQNILILEPITANHSLVPRPMLQAFQRVTLKSWDGPVYEAKHLKSLVNGEIESGERKLQISKRKIHKHCFIWKHVMAVSTRSL